MEYVKGKIQQGVGNVYFVGMQWCGIIFGYVDVVVFNQFDIDISKVQVFEVCIWLFQNKVEFIVLILGIEVVKVGQ